MAICVESSSNEEQISRLSQLNEAHVVSAQDVFQPSIEKLIVQKKRKEDITNWINAKTKLVSHSILQ